MQIILMYEFDICLEKKLLPDVKSGTCVQFRSTNQNTNSISVTNNEISLHGRYAQQHL